MSEQTKRQLRRRNLTVALILAAVAIFGYVAIGMRWQMKMPGS